MFLDALPLSYTGSVLSGLCYKCHDALVRNDDNTGNPFRSSDLVVMSHARCLCAMPVNFGGGVKEFVLLRLLIHIYI